MWTEQALKPDAHPEALLKHWVPMGEDITAAATALGWRSPKRIDMAGFRLIAIRAVADAIGGVGEMPKLDRAVLYLALNRAHSNGRGRGEAIQERDIAQQGFAFAMAVKGLGWT